jgi:hypothetical protein
VNVGGAKQLVLDRLKNKAKTPSKQSNVGREQIVASIFRAVAVCVLANEIGFLFALTFAERQFFHMANRQLIR